jgi:cytochrome c-type biogenesis protein CcmH/NrfF
MIFDVSIEHYVLWVVPVALVVIVAVMLLLRD